MPWIRKFGIFFSSNIYSYTIFCLSYCLFSRDQAFYLAFCYSFTTILSTTLEVTYRRPQFIMQFPDEDSKQMEILKNRFQCLNNSYYPFAFPNFEMMIQIVFTLNLYLLDFHTKRNKYYDMMQVNL